MKVRSYIVLLTSASLLGSIIIAFFAWYTYDRLEQATNSYENEKNLYGDTSTELEDINALLAVVRNIFISMEIYPDNYDGLYSVTLDGVVSAKGGLNEISRKYGERFPETLLKPIAYRIEELEKKVKRLHEIAVSPKDKNLLETKMVAKREYDDVREKLMKNLDML